MVGVDESLIGQITTQLLRQDMKEDRAAGVDAYAFSNKVGDIEQTYHHYTSQVVRDHVDAEYSDLHGATPSGKGEGRPMRGERVELPRGPNIIAARARSGDAVVGICFLENLRTP